MGATTLTSGLLRPAFRIDRSQIDVVRGVQCALAVALPLAVGLATGHDLPGAWGAIGAFLADFSTFQPGYRVRVRVVVAAAVVVAVATFLGAVTGVDSPAVFPLMAGWSFLAGLLVTLGPSAAMVGVVSSVGMAVATALNATPAIALEDAAAAFCGGLGAAVVAFAFHRGGRRAESTALAAAYRSLAGYATGITHGTTALPEAGCFDTLAATLAVPGPHRTRSLAYRDRALADRAERLRTLLAALAVTRDRLQATAGATPAAGAAVQPAVDAVDLFAAAAGAALDELARGCGRDQPPPSTAVPDQALATAQRRLRQAAGVTARPVAELFTEIHRALVAAAALLLGPGPDAAEAVSPAAGAVSPAAGAGAAGGVRHELRVLTHRPDALDEARLALRANLTLRSTTCRHALRLAVTVAVATALYRVIDTHDGYWIVVAVLFIMKPDFGSTVGRGMLRAVGTLVGVTLTTLLLATLRPGPVLLAVITVAAAVFAYSLFTANYGAFTVFLTCLTVSLAAFTGLPPMTAVANRAVDNVIAAALTIVAVVVWPTWVATEVPGLVAACLRAEHRFGDAVLSAFVRRNETPVDEETVDRLVREARLARSNAEAAVQRMAAETPGVGKGRLSLPAAEGMLAQMHRYGLAGLSLRVHHDHPDPSGLPELAAARQAVTDFFATLAAAVDGGASGPVPPFTGYPPAAATLPPAPIEQLVADELRWMAAAVATCVDLYDDNLTGGAGPAAGS